MGAEVTIQCDNCSTTRLDERDKIYCEQCYDEKEDKISELELSLEEARAEIAELNEQIENMEGE